MSQTYSQRLSLVALGTVFGVVGSFIGQYAWHQFAKPTLTVAIATARLVESVGERGDSLFAAATLVDQGNLETVEEMYARGLKSQNEPGRERVDDIALYALNNPYDVSVSRIRIGTLIPTLVAPEFFATPNLEYATSDRRDSVAGETNWITEVKYLPPRSIGIFGVRFPSDSGSRAPDQHPRRVGTLFINASDAAYKGSERIQFVDAQQLYYRLGGDPKPLQLGPPILIRYQGSATVSMFQRWRIAPLVWTFLCGVAAVAFAVALRQQRVFHLVQQGRVGTDILGTASKLARGVRPAKKLLVASGFAALIAVGFLGWMRLILGVIWWSPLPAMAETVGVGAALLALVELGMWREVARKIGSAEAGVEEAASRLAVIKRTQRIMTASTSAILATLLIQNGAADVLFPMALGLILLSAALVVSEWRLFLPLSRFVGVGLLVSLLAAPALLQLMQVGSMFVRSALRR